MADQRRTGAGNDRKAAGERRPVPRDLPDQQAGEDRDPWDAAEHEDDERADEELPDTDESGTGKRGAARSGGVHPEHPAPDESSA